jgi:phosphoglycerate dehydrogenase-like enzyme
VFLMSAADPRAAVTEAAIDAVRERAPDGADVVVLEETAQLTTVDFIVPRPASLDRLDELRSLERLSVVQVLSAGTDRIEPYVPADVTLCSARGARDGPVAEWILGALLGASAGLLEYARATRWNRDRTVEDLASWTVLIVGMGSIGHRLRAYLQPIGTRVVGVASRRHDGLHGPDELPDLLPAADAVVVLAPLSDATHGLIGREALARMRDGTLVINAARGQVVDTDALLAELQRERLRAVLDVVDPEPLPDDHPLWRAPGLLCLTPHIAGDSPAGQAHAAALAGDQFARWCRGEPLINVVRRVD